MIILQETTDWAHLDVRNHIYVLNDSQTHAIAYVPEGSDRVVRFRKPLTFDRRGRTFLPLEGESKAASPSRTVEGTRGAKYSLVQQEGVWHCSCPGFLSRQKCRHVESVDS